MSLALADTQTPLPQLLQTEVYAVQELAEVRVIDTQAQLWRYALLGETVSLRSVMLREYLRDWLERWRSEAGFSSLLMDKRTHPIYQRIVEMGEEAIPLLLEEIQSRPSFVFMALHDITGDDPIAPEHRGRLEAMIEDWLRWGTERGFTR
jgi:hypothetical protein